MLEVLHTVKIISQLFERIFLIRLESIKTSNNQFGFKPKSSCNLTIFSLRETIINYVENGSPCYMAALDAEKAFDKLWRDGIFFKLINKIDKLSWITLRRYYCFSGKYFFEKIFYNVWC
jgi:hypothetical protein